MLTNVGIKCSLRANIHLTRFIITEPINIDFVKAIFCKSIDGDFVGNKAEITIQKVVDDYELEICKYSYFCSTFTVSSTEFK